MRHPIRSTLAALLCVLGGTLRAQDYPYSHAPKIFYVVGQPTWDGLASDDGGKKKLVVYATQDLARDNAGSRPIYRIQRHVLASTPDGKAFLESVERDRVALSSIDQFSMVLRDPASFQSTVVKNARTGSDLGPVNPNLKTTGPYASKEMEGDYRPGNPRDDYEAGTFYFWNEGSPDEVNFINNFRVSFERQADGTVLLMQPDPNNQGKLRPIDTRGLSPGGPGDVNTCLFVMDAEGNFFVISPEWVKGLAEHFGLSRMNHSSLPAGHPVAAAGHLTIEGGRLKLIDNRSGHYHPSNAMTVQAINALERHGVAKGSFRVGFGNGASDHPGEQYIALDPEGKAKVEKGEIEPPKAPVVAPQGTRVPDANAPKVDDAALLAPAEPTPNAQLDVERRAALEKKFAARRAAAQPVEPPDQAVKDQIEQLVTDRAPDKMDVQFMRDVYKTHPDAAKVVGQLMAKDGFGDKNLKMGQLRKQMDLMVWKELLASHNIRVEITNQGKANGIRSDLDYTLYYIAEEAGIPIEDLIKEHTETWQRLHGVTPEQVEIKVMNGDEFYPDWRSEALGEAEYRSQVKDMLGRLRGDKEKYSVPGANKQQVHNRALREGWTEMLAYDPEADKPDAPIEKVVIRDAGATRDIAERYRGVHPQYNHMNALGNVIQNYGEYTHHSGDGVQDAIRRAKYGNRIINEGLGHLRFFPNSYQQIYDSDPTKVWGTRKDKQVVTREFLLKDYLKRTFGTLVDDNGRPLFDDAKLDHFRKIIDISMQIELDKTGDRNGKKADFSDKLAEYFKDYRQEAEATVNRELENQQVDAKVREKLILAEQQYLFELQHREVLAEAVLAGLRQSVARDLTPEGVLRNRVRFDPATQKFVLEDAAGARKVAFERATEVALFYELVNGIKDPVVRHDLKKRALSTAPNIDLAEFYGALDQVTHAEIDRFIKGEPNEKIQRTIDDLIKRQEQRALELAIEQKEKAVAAAKARGVAVEPTTVPPEEVRNHVVDGRLWGLNPERRAQFTKAYQALGTQLSGDFKDAFYNNASALMMGSSAVNLARAYQSGCTGTTSQCAAVMGRAAFSEAIWYMPDYIQTPFLAVDLLAKVHEGKYGDAAWSATLFAAMAQYPELGHAMLAYNIVNGSLEIVHTHFVTRIDKDLTEQALKSRPRDENGGPIRDGALGPARARANRYPDAKESVYNGSPPGFPLFYGRYKNDNAIAAAAVVDGVRYSDGTVPQDNLGDTQLADTAAAEFAPQIDSILTAEGLQAGTDAWARRAWELKLKFGFDVPFYRRISKVYDEKYKYITFYDNYPGRFQPEYLSACRADVYEWYVKQPQGYKDELAGEARGIGALFNFLRDQTDKMQEMIAQECAVVMANQHMAVAKAEEVDRTNRAAFKAITTKAFDAERSLLAAKQSLRQRIQSDEERATAQLEQKALDLAAKHQTFFELTYPFTYASEELPPNLGFHVRTLPANVKGPVGMTVDEEIIDIKEGAPGGWRPGKAWADKFKPDKDGWVELRPITATVRFLAHLLDKDSVEVAQAKLELPVVLYEPTVNGYVSVQVFAMGEKGDSSTYNGALVTLGKDTKPTMELGNTFFSKLQPGSYTVQVAPMKGDERHSAGTGSGTITDVLFSKDPKAKQNAMIVVKLPYVPEKKIAEKPEDKKPADKTNAGAGKDSTANKPGPGGGGGRRDSTGTKGGANDSTSTKGGKKDSTTTIADVNDIISKLTPLTSKSEKARDDAKAACKYIEAANAQQELVTASKNFIAKSFPRGAPAAIQNIADGFNTELVALKRAATAQEKANVFLREGLAGVRTKHAIPALEALEKAAAVPDIPECLYDQVMKLYNEIKGDLEKRMKLIDQAVDAANNKCDYIGAQKIGEQVETEDANLPWVTKEYPRIKDLAQRQKNARNLAAQAESKAAEAEQVAQGGDLARAKVLFDNALELARQALVAAPECEKANLKNLLDLPARKAALTDPKIDQSLILLLDTSGSMGDNNKMENAKQAATDAVKSLGPTTEVAVISYDGSCSGGWRVVQGFTTDHQSLFTALAGLRPGGGTPTAPAIGFASDYLQKNHRGKAGQIMLMTDGQNDCGSMVDAGNALRRSSIPIRIDAVGFGLGDGSKAQSDLSALVGAAGNGASYSANSAKELISAFRRAFITNQIKPRDPYVSGDAGTRLSQLFAAAIEFLKQNNLQGAVDQLHDAATQFPASPAAAFNASLAYEAAGQPLQAMNYAKKYLNLSPNAFDAGQVQARIEVLEKEQAANPRAIYSPTDCSTLYRWAQTESRTGGMDALRRAKVFDIMTTAQRGDCAAAQTAYDKYVQQYGKRP